MDLIANLLLAAGAIGSGLYCLVLSRRLQNFTNLEKGVGGAVAALSAQVEDLRSALTKAEGAAKGSVATLNERTARAEDVARRLELLLASMHDLPESPSVEPENPFYMRSGGRW